MPGEIKNIESESRTVLNFDGNEFATSKYLFSKGIIICPECGNHLPYEFRFCETCKKYVIFIIEK
jgi:hypothetical protein